MDNLREEFEEEKGFTYWTEGCDYGSFNDEYVAWLENRLALSITAVSHQRELLIAYQKFENGDGKIYACDEQNIDDFIKGN